VDRSALAAIGCGLPGLIALVRAGIPLTKMPPTSAYRRVAIHAEDPRTKPPTREIRCAACGRILAWVGNYLRGDCGLADVQIQCPCGLRSALVFLSTPLSGCASPPCAEQD